jgi:hypothetical protein
MLKKSCLPSNLPVVAYLGRVVNVSSASRRVFASPGQSSSKVHPTNPPPADRKQRNPPFIANVRSNPTTRKTMANTFISHAEEEKAIRALGPAATAVRAFALLCQHNSNVRNADDDASNSTPFHSASVPPMSLFAYAARIVTYGECLPEGLLLGLRLAGRYCRKAKVVPTMLLAHRLVLVATTVAVKIHADKFRSNRTMAKVGGIPLQELNELENGFCFTLDFRLVLHISEIQAMQKHCDSAMSTITSSMSPANQLERLDVFDASEAFGIQRAGNVARLQALATWAHVKVDDSPDYIAANRHDDSVSLEASPLGCAQQRALLEPLSNGVFLGSSGPSLTTSPAVQHSVASSHATTTITTTD